VQLDPILSHTIEIGSWKDGEYDDILANGFQVFLVKDGLIEFIVNLWETWDKLFYCDDGMADRNMQFLKEKMNFTLSPRKQQVVTLNETDIKSGMYLGIFRLDGLGTMIMWGTGSRTGHTAMTMWDNGELYVMESTATAAPLSCKFWPGPENVMKTPWKQWIEDATNAKFMVTIFPLSQENQDNFDEEKALTFFKSVEGLPYGMSNFIFGWVDTFNNNFPPPLSETLVASAFAFMDRIYPSGANTLYMDGINLRLQMMGLPTCVYIECVIQQLEKINMSFGELLSIPEEDSFVYPNGKQMVCDVFVLSMYKAGGVFGDLDFQASEQTPRDSYMLDIYDKTWKRPEVCNVDDLPFCQILGEYTLELPGWSTITPYANMNQKCTSQPVEYERCPGIPFDDNRCKC